MRPLSQLLAVLALTTAAEAAAPAPAPAMQLPAQLVQSAAPTRNGPLDLTRTRGEFALRGPVRAVTIRRQVPQGKTLRLDSTEVLSYDARGRLVSRVLTDPLGQVRERLTVRYDGSRLAGETSLGFFSAASRRSRQPETRVRSYTYTAAGDLRSETERDDHNRVLTVWHYQGRPNGYIRTQFRDGQEVEPMYVLQDAAGHAVRQESPGASWAVMVSRYDGDVVARSTLDIDGYHEVITEAAGVRRWEAQGGEDREASVTTFSRPDRFGNPQAVTEQTEVPGERPPVRFTVAVESRSYEYY